MYYFSWTLNISKLFCTAACEYKIYDLQPKPAKHTALKEVVS